MTPATPAPAESRRELIGAAVLLLAGVGIRLAFIRAFPTIPFSDFRALIDFGLRLRDRGLVAPGWGWVQFNPGLPLLLSLLLRIFPSDPETAARTATAVVTGLTPLAPFLIWRPILAFRARLLAGLLLALWPGQVFFSGVVAQENWALLPAVALACLGVRGARLPEARPRPVAAGLLFAAACAIRQELLVVLLPLLLPAAGVWPSRLPGTLRRVAALGLAAGVPLLLLAAERRAASGRFALTTEHGGLGLLGSVAPGAAADGWIDPTPYLAARRPELLRDLKALREAAAAFAAEELRRRWRYNAFRAGVTSMRLLRDSDAEDLFWSVGAADALPPGRRDAGAAFAARWGPILPIELAAITGLFAAAVLAAARRRDPAILLLALAVLLKVAIQALVSPMGRLMVPAVALELLAIALAAALPPAPLRERAGLLLCAVAVAAVLLAATPPLRALARRKDDAPLPIRRFPLALGGGGFAECALDSGRLTGIHWGRARLTLESPSPPPGESARLTCELPAGHAPLRLRLEDAYAPTGYTGRVLERVAADGRELLSHDIGGPEGATWLEVPLGDARAVTIEILAVHPDPGWAWGTASTATFEIVRP